MRAFLKTLFGDLRNCGVVVVLIAVEAGLVRAGLAHVAPLVLPPLCLVGVSWLAWSGRRVVRG
ncbi:hypothetical protein [Limobrevibacterium gyesilva]|uniref:Uncharacterized protein n=1 Tax=Limobrevibacterium gyesilva TaxID=2991712 RepID=A0AA41YN53_9PROT|nr:hypothetical protein [Limobrevibacterium gyesilva]MCW3475417.1 hypothetical protein [Limobrevibacterium gyesilva]